MVACPIVISFPRRGDCRAEEGVEHVAYDAAVYGVGGAPAATVVLFDEQLDARDTVFGGDQAEAGPPEEVRVVPVYYVLLDRT
jgi:hypothetical protein